ncbi:cysteine-rich CWC family protein [Cohnella lupini]|nr:cysteine-rich CWC family protein [Cohnella lupini]
MPHGECWCSKVVEFPREILELIPAEQRNKACICQACIDKAGNRER